MGRGALQANTSGTNNTSVGNFSESAPTTYQPGERGRKLVSCRYVLKNSLVKFDAGDYDPSQILVIDPSIIFCSFFAFS